ncbi:MAG: SpoIID/LytB domain-containing protein [Clostridia bacterium]
MKRNSTVKVVLFIVVLLLLVSCTSCRRQERRPVPEPAPLKIPESISRGQGKEPVLKVYIKETGEIKELSFEEYLQGVVAGEMKNDWPEEALAAQAILARTFVMEFVSEKGGSKYEGAHVSTDIEEAQAWNQQAVNDRVKRAVERTRGEVAVYNNNYIKAWFHAHAGGRTASAKEGLAFEEAEPPYIKVVDSPDSPEAPKDDSNWTASFSRQEVEKALSETGVQIKGLNSVKVAEKGPSGRAVTLDFDGKRVSAPGFRIAIGSTKMKSTLIDSIEVRGDRLVIKGRGYGHGVGMSQWGAYALAKEGKKAEEILKHYFKGIEIMKAWE